MIYFIIAAVLIVIILGFVIYFMSKKIKKLKNENDKLFSAIKRQREVIDAFEKIEQEAREQKEKLGHGSTDDRVQSSLDVLRDLENRR